MNRTLLPDFFIFFFLAQLKLLNSCSVATLNAKHCCWHSEFSATAALRCKGLFFSRITWRTLFSFVALCFFHYVRLNFPFGVFCQPWIQTSVYHFFALCFWGKRNWVYNLWDFSEHTFRTTIKPHCASYWPLNYDFHQTNTINRHGNMTNVLLLLCHVIILYFFLPAVLLFGHFFLESFPAWQQKACVIKKHKKVTKSNIFASTIASLNMCLQLSQPLS